jgi:hypothetical protein
VKKLIFFIVAIQIISSGNFFTEISKLDELYLHFMEHRNGDQPMSVTQFIQSHYFDNIHENSDPVRHAKLPLRQSSLSFNLVYQTPVEGINLIPYWSFIKQNFIPTQKCFLPQAEQFSVFQPPKYS